MSTTIDPNDLYTRLGRIEQAVSDVQDDVKALTKKHDEVAQSHWSFKFKTYGIAAGFGAAASWLMPILKQIFP